MYNLWLFIDGNGAKRPTDTGVKNHQLCCQHKKSSDKASWENRWKKYEHFGSGQKASNLKMQSFIRINLQIHWHIIT